MRPQTGLLNNPPILKPSLTCGTQFAPMSSPESKLPRHVAIIMDGNGRWAESRGCRRTEGHRRGAEAVRRTVRAGRALGLEALTLYAFSAQNWKRPATEVGLLMKLLRDYLNDEREEMMENGIRLTTIGDVGRLPGFVREPLEARKADTAANDKMTLCLALSYGSRESIVGAAKAMVERAAKGRLKSSEIDIDLVSDLLPTAELPPLDLVIRTSGEQRISNFLLWEAAYAELYFTETFWPDFERHDLEKALAAYANRERRFGLTGQQVKLQVHG